MTGTLAEKVIAGIHSQRWTLSGYGGTWAGAMRPLEEYVKRKVKKAVAAEREACAVAAEEQARRIGYNAHADAIASAVRARGNT